MPVSSSTTDPPQDPKPGSAPEDPSLEELLDSGQEEVFSRTEVELGRIEHASEAGGDHSATNTPTQEHPRAEGPRCPD